MKYSCEIQEEERRTVVLSVAPRATCLRCGKSGHIDDTARASMSTAASARVLEIQAECMADDVPLLDDMSGWSDVALRAYFESGGQMLPDPDDSTTSHTVVSVSTPVIAAPTVTAAELDLLHAAETGDEQTVRDVLLHKAAQVSVDVIDQHGFFPLMLAARNGHEGTVKALVQNRAHLSQTSDRFTLQRTALMAAALEGHETTVRTLLLHGAHSDQKDRNGDTALDLALSKRHDAAAQTLRELRGMCL